LASSQKVQYQLNETGEFIITGYNSAKLFSSFFPGIAGKEGIPMWLFYVNRGQCVCSMGIKDKEHPIMEFLPANRAYQLTSTQGFRTFIKLHNQNSPVFYEPFQDHLRDNKIERIQKMKICPFSLILEEENHTLGLKFEVSYFNIPQENYSGLVRILKIENMKPETVTLEGLDGLPLIIPYGINNVGLKFMRRLFEAFVEVSNYETGVPFFRGKVKPTDTPDVVKIKKGNFYVGFETTGEQARLIKPIVDPYKIFGTHSDLSYPENFLSQPVADLYKDQILENRLPCSMGSFKTSIPAGGTYTYYSIIGHAPSLQELNKLIPRITKKFYIDSRKRENKELIKSLTQNNFICSSQPVLDQYARQNFLDNTMRGGFPFTIKGKDSQFTLHLFSRKHGDLERDYNDYKLTPTHYSQGNGNYRDVNQNRRNDLLFNPDVKENNVVQFYNLIQLDGFNPLVIKDTRFKIKNESELTSILKKYLPENKLELMYSFFQFPFTPGEFTTYVAENQIDLKENPQLLLAAVVNISDKVHDTDYGEGFWTDHWTYNLDLLENYSAVYPENLHDLLFQKMNFTFYDNPHIVKPRDEKYVIWEGKTMQLGAVFFDEEKELLISQRKANKNLVHTKYGKGKVYSTSLLNKLICLIVNKMASLDPQGVGVEMEADKPDWYDALNGLPGLIGSSLSETLEVKRHIQFLLTSFRSLNINNKEWPIFTELKSFMETLRTLLQNDLTPFAYWDKATAAKEFYRDKTRLGIKGNESTVNIEYLTDFFFLCLKKLETGINKAWNKKDNVIFTYFINEVKAYEEITEIDQQGNKIKKTNPKGLICFKAKKFKQIPLPLFLEGPVHFLRLQQDRGKARELAANIKKSGLYDKKLKMYKVNESLAQEPAEIGRARTFSPGWFENESIWLHMEYKYMLELLRSGLYEEFYNDFKNVFVPFFKPEIYGRSILENSSFIVSSANPDPSIHGNGFVARLSGATAEFIHILSVMTMGTQPFTLNQQGELQLQFKPVLPGWLFTREAKKHRLLITDKWQDIELSANTFSFIFLGKILVTYHNAELTDTFGPQGVSPAIWKITDLKGSIKEFTGNILPEEIATSIRSRQIKSIDIILNNKLKQESVK